MLKIFNIQHYSVHDGPGIRTTLFLKGCPLSCKWCCNPESQDFETLFRYSSVRCKHCGNCIKSCPSRSAHMDGELLTFDFKKCNECINRPCLSICYHNAISLVGTDYTTQQVIDIIEKDHEYYNNSGGGVTFSGGEPLSQATSLIEVLKLCKERNISTAVETCGYVNTERVIEAAEWIDIFLFDIKICDSESHIQYTGQDNELIHRNLAILSKLNKRIVARVPLIPEATDKLENISDIIAVCLRNNIKEATLGIYHRLGEQKYTDFGIENTFQHSDITQPDEHYLNIQKMFESAGIQCDIL